MKRLLYLILILSVLTLLALQSMTRQPLNQGDAQTAEAFLTAYQVPAETAQLLRQSCFDCHSDHTRYPWYGKLQPLNRWINHHIEEGKSELNFSAFDQYPLRKKLHKLEEIAEQVDEHEMPLRSYTLVHRSAALNEAQRGQLSQWAQALRSSLQIASGTGEAEKALR